MTLHTHADEIVRKRAEGATLDALAAEYGYTREWVRKVLLAVDGPTVADLRRLSRDKRQKEREARQRETDALRQRVLARVRDEPGRSSEEVGAEFGITGLRVMALVRDAPEASLVHHLGSAVRATDSAVVLDALRTVCGEVDGACTLKKYDAARNGRGLSGVRIIQRYGKWSTALLAAGVSNPGKSSTTGSHRSDRIPDEAVLDAVGHCWAQTGVFTAHGYAAWASAVGSPSLTLAIQRFGGWRGVKAAMAARDQRKRRDAGEDARRTVDPAPVGNRERPGE